MKITVFNLKGGQGKTTLSLSIAMLYDFFIVTNDEYSPINKLLPSGHVKHITKDQGLPSIPDSINVIYDFGGYPDVRVIEASKMSDWVLIPIIYESPLDMQTAIKTIREIEQHTKKIVIVINKTKKGDMEKAKKILDDFFSYPLFEVKKSTVFIHMVQKKQSIKSLFEGNYLYRYHYKEPYRQIEALKNFIS